MTYLHHVTLTTGHVRRSVREEISAAALAVCRRLIDEALADTTRTVPVPGVDGYSLAAQAVGRCTTLTVWADGPPSECVGTVGIASHSRCGAGLWQALHRDGASLATSADQCPPEPWCAARLEEAIVRHVDATEWLGDLERCLAWAWLGRRQS